MSSASSAMPNSMPLVQDLDAFVDAAILVCVILLSHMLHCLTFCHRRARSIEKRSHREMSPPVSELAVRVAAGYRSSCR
jgi:hypothetical protein